MRLELGDAIETDVLVIGGGGAGLRAAIAATEAGARALILSDSRVGYGSLTAVSGGAFASTREADWKGHFTDTVVGGRFLGDQELVTVLATRIDSEARQLAEYGARYLDQSTTRWLSHVIDPGHHAAAMVYGQNAIGTDITFTLRRRAEALGVVFIEGAVATRLIAEDNNALGAIALSPKGSVLVVSARATVLATGGMGQVYARTDNTPGATGDGYALAYRAGLALRDMEFMQFYPCALGKGTPGIYYEILVSGLNCPLLNNESADIRQIHSLIDPHSTTRDYLSIAIMREVDAGHGVEGGAILDLSRIAPEVLEDVAPIMPKAWQRGVTRFPVAPTAHTHLGGVVIDPSGHTDLEGLYCAGEVCGGVHGANRLGGNALSETLVFGSIAGNEAALRAAERPSSRIHSRHVADEKDRLEKLSRGGNVDTKAMSTRLKNLMWTNAGVLRSEESLTLALEGIDELKDSLHSVGASDGRGLQRLVKLRNSLLSAEFLCRSALVRTESRGAHYRTDYPTEDSDWLCSTFVRKGPSGPSISTRPVSFPHLRP